MLHLTRHISRTILAASLLLSIMVMMLINTPLAHASGEPVSVWLTTPDQSHLLAAQNTLTFSNSINTGATTINVNDNVAYQQMVGFGASMTDSSAWLIYNKLSTAQRSTLMSKLFDPSNGIGLNFLRQPIGSSDLSLNEYTYDDLTSGQTDTSMAHFSINHDTAYIIPTLQQALQLNPNIKIMGTPWSPPAWMKSNNSLNSGGSLNASDYAAYAQYLVDFIKAYQAQGVPIYAITPQNEPLNTNNMPTMSFPASSETTFIANNLGPAFAQNGLSTKIFGFDHNWDIPDYPTTIMNNATANGYTNATAWHCYGGTADAMATFHNAFPTRDIYETECSDGTWVGANWPDGFKYTMELLINSTRNWSKSVTLWGMALDTNNGPYLNTPGSCSTCRGVVTINQSNGNVTYNSDYYGLGQASKFVAQGATRISSNSFGSGNLEDVAFKNPDGSKVLVAYNAGSASNTFQVQWNNESFSYTLPSGAAATFKWSGNNTVAAPTTGTNYYLLNRNSGKALDVTNQSTANGTLIQQWTQVNGQANQQWSFKAADSGFYYIVNKNSGKVLDDTSRSTTNGTTIQQWTQVNGQLNQQWALLSAGGGYYYIINRYSGKVLDVTNWSTADGGGIQQWDYVSGQQANQEWKLALA